MCNQGELMIQVRMCHMKKTSENSDGVSVLDCLLCYVI